MNDKRARIRNADFLDILPLSETVASALVQTVGSLRAGTPLQTGALLAALAEADGIGDWSRIWPSYEGGADAQLAAADDTRAAESGFSWLGMTLSKDLLSALRLLALMAGKYQMNPIQPGAVALALAANPGSGAARHLGELSATEHGELLERIQSDLLGRTLDGFADLSQRLAIQEAFAEGTPVSRWHVLARQATAVFCAWVAWLALRAAVGGIIGAVTVALTVLLSAAATTTSRLHGSSPSGGPRRWQVELRPRYASPAIMVMLFLIGLAGVTAFYGRHRMPALFTPTLVVLGGFLAATLLTATFHAKPRLSATAQKFPVATLLPDDFRYRTLFGTPVVLAGIAGVITWYARIGLISLRPLAPGAQLRWPDRALYWLHNVFVGAFLGKSFERAYWPLLVAAVAAAGGYFSALAAQLVLTRARRKAGVWAAGSCAAGLLIVGVSYLPATTGTARVPASHSSAASLVTSYDEETINRLHNRCQGFEPSAKGCPFTVAQTPDGQNGVLYAIALTATAGDSCAGSIVYFFDGEDLITDTTQLPPGGTPAMAGLSSPGPGQFTIAWRVNPTADVPCAQYGTVGTDPYLYSWDGATITLAAGTPPRSPEAFPPGSSMHREVPGYLARLEYCGTTSISADGSAAPLTCADGRPSWSADDHFRELRLKVLALGEHAAVRDVETAVCGDARHTNLAVASDGLQLAAAEQAWSYTALNFSRACGFPGQRMVLAKPTERNGWTSAELPVTATRASSPSIACPSARRCVAVGNFVDYSVAQPDPSGLGFPPLLVENGSSWTATEPIVLPEPTATLAAVTCPSLADCVAVGDGLLLTYSGSALTALAAPVPGGVKSSDTSVGLSAVACATPSSCVAVGDYSEYIRTPHASFPGPDRGALITGSGQRWTAITMPLPPDAAGDPKVYMYSVACPTAVRCIAVGQYTDTAGHEQTALVSGAGSSWTAVRAAVPNAGTGVVLQSVTCPAAGRCLAVGSYTDSNGHGQGLIESGSGTQWTATEAPLPANASVAPSAGLNSITCPSTSTCVALGNYIDSSGNFQGYLVTQSDSAWRATEAPLPTNAAANPIGTFSGPQTTFDAVACPTTSACVAIGEYLDQSGYFQGVVLTGSGSSWTAEEAPLPGSANANPDVTLSVLECPAVAMCTVIGEYTDASGQAHGLVMTQRG